LIQGDCAAVDPAKAKFKMNSNIAHCMRLLVAWITFLILILFPGISAMIEGTYF
jgi:hypothetical protein